MQILKASEDYLETMLMMQTKHGYVRSVDVAEHLGVTKPSVTYATKRLRENGYIEMDKDGLITLTDSGMQIAAKMLQRHHTLTNFLVDLGVMTPEGKIVHARYDKFRQINRFLEFVEDILPALPKDRELTILDFGCGKSYLTFAIYYYLRECQGLDVRIIGLDLKEDVIRKCSDLSSKYGYDKLTFLQGDIAGYEGCTQVDMVVTLHACDTATDYALYKAVKWGASVILSVPCCQHELNKQIENETLAPVLKYGLLKERMSALITDGLRAGLLEQQGYNTQILEFIDMEHTPKNILIRAVKRKNGKKAEAASAAAFENCTEALHADLTLEKLLSAGTSPAESYRSRRKNTENAKGESR